MRLLSGLSILSLSRGSTTEDNHFFPLVPAHQQRSQVSALTYSISNSPPIDRVAAAAHPAAAPPAYANNDGEDGIDDDIFDRYYPCQYGNHYGHHGDSDNDSEEDDNSDDANAFRDVGSTPTSPRGSFSGAHASREYDRTSHE